MTEERMPPGLDPVLHRLNEDDQCPILDFKPMAGHRPAGESFSLLDELRESHPAFRSTFAKGFWVLTWYDSILEAYQTPEVFSNASINVLDPNPPYKWIPEMLDPPEHTVWRRLLRPSFGPGRIKVMEERIRQRCADLIDGFADSGECDFVADFAKRFPTTIFLELMGLPVERLETFLGWAETVLHGPPGRDSGAARKAAMGEVAACFAELIEQRRAEPRDDLISEALTWEIDGEPIPLADLLALCVLLFLAGLDTVTAQLSYGFWHLATHPGDRARVAAEPEIIPTTVEELLRVHAIVLAGRKVTRDVDFAGCPMKGGDMVMLPLAMASRDPRQFPEPDKVILEREPNRHLGFGAGPHRCLGAHLARLEMRVALEEWHRRIPDYRLGGEAIEHRYGLLGLDTLPLTWA